MLIDSDNCFTILRLLRDWVETCTDSLSFFTIPRPFITEVEISNVSFTFLTTFLAVPLNT